MRKIVWRYPEASERQVGRLFDKQIVRLIDGIKERTRSIKFDDVNGQISDAERDLASLAGDVIASIVSYLPAIAVQMYTFNASEFVRLARATGGGKNSAVLLLIMFGANQSEKWFNPSLTNWRKMAEDSVTKLVNNILSDWNVTVRGDVLHSADQSKIYDDVESRFSVYRSWARNRATGVCGTWYSALMRQRIADTGVTHYFWRGVMDLREREKHVQWEGKRIAVNSDHVFPGEEFNCRCWPVPDWETVNNER